MAYSVPESTQERINEIDREIKVLLKTTVALTLNYVITDILVKSTRSNSKFLNISVFLKFICGINVHTSLICFVEDKNSNFLLILNRDK